MPHDVDEASHDPTVDKHGKEVSAFVTEAIKALRNDKYHYKVICDYYRTGKLQYYAVRNEVPGEVVRIAREHGYQLDICKTREKDGKERGYAEFSPQAHDREQESEFRYK